MQKSILITIFLYSLLSANSFLNKPAGFDEFLDLALRLNPEIHTASISIEQSNKEAKQLLNYENPSLELEVASFNPNAGGSELGSRIAISQSIRLWGVGDDKKAYSSSQMQLLKSQQKLTRSMFIYNISTDYLNYIYSVKELKLTIESLALAKKIFDISDAMFKAGKISRAEMFQAKVAFSSLNSQMATQKYQQTKSYYELLKQSNITQDINIDIEYTFDLKNEKSISPELEVLKQSSLNAQSKATLNSNKIEWMELLAEYEAEPDENIYRLGISMPLAIFNTNSEAKEIALLQVKKQDSLIASREAMVIFELKQLFRELNELKTLKQTHEDVLENERELLEMFEEGYKIANINLLSLQNIKNSVINTKANILNIELSKQRNIIKINYLQGSFNE